MTLEDIGKGADTALLCVTNLTACCQREVLGKWLFPNGTRVPSVCVSNSKPLPEVSLTIIRNLSL